MDSCIFYLMQNLLLYDNESNEIFPKIQCDTQKSNTVDINVSSRKSLIQQTPENQVKILKLCNNLCVDDIINMQNDIGKQVRIHYS